MDKLLSCISKLFKNCGIRGINMDDIARELCIPKKTLRQSFETKNDVLGAVVQFELRTELRELEDISNSLTNAIDQIVAISTYLETKVFNLNHILIHDLKKYHPSIWDAFKNQRELQIQSLVNRNLQMGIRQGLYHENIKTENFIVSYLLRLHFIDYEICNNKTNEKHNESYDTLFLYHIYSIANDSGIKYLQQRYGQ